ncbi:hypothetical protein OT109_02835 [Phycisphaeraceae bacterium D3-23]
MGLDACVYCDCFERGLIREAPPTDTEVQVASDGSLLCGSDRLETQLAFDRWLYTCRMCKHAGGVLLHHRIGNIALVGALRSELESLRESIPVIFEKVIYSGSHAGDFLGLEDVVFMQSELDSLGGFLCSQRDYQHLMDEFLRQMQELVTCSLAVGKPIVF